MRELIIKCDRCGDVIEYDPYKIRFFMEDRNPTGDMDLVRGECDKLDLCQNCIEELFEIIEQFARPINIIEQFARPEEYIRTEEAEPEAAEEPEPETGGGRTGAGTTQIPR